MKNKLIILLITIISLFIILCGCTSEESKEENKTNSFLLPTSYNNLYYDSTTKIVYFTFHESSGYLGYGYMSPYYAANGYPYLYDPSSQALVEIDNN